MDFEGVCKQCMKRNEELVEYTLGYLRKQGITDLIKEESDQGVCYTGTNDCIKLYYGVFGEPLCFSSCIGRGHRVKTEYCRTERACKVVVDKWLAAAERRKVGKVYWRENMKRVCRGIGHGSKKKNVIEM